MHHLIVALLSFWVQIVFLEHRLPDDHPLHIVLRQLAMLARGAKPTELRVVPSGRHCSAFVKNY